jgi:LCP family protein required for cell wall assembly
MRKKKLQAKKAGASNGQFEVGRSLPNSMYSPGYMPRNKSDKRQQLGDQPYQQKTRGTGGRKQVRPARKVAEKPEHSWKKGFVTVVVLVMLALGAYGGWVGYKFADNAVHVFGWKGLFSLFWPSKLKGEDTGRVNILLAGNSADDVGHNGANLTDSIMILSVNTNDHTAYLLSVPRDLYVNIPGAGYGKINEAYQDGKAQNFNQPGYAPGGMGLLEEVVSQKFGVNIDYYALVNYSAFRDAVDSVGGITVTINSPDGRLYDPNKDYKTNGPLVDLTNGVHTLTGEQALDLARARGDPNPFGYPIGYERSDFTRTANQRLMLVALKDKASSFSVLANPIKFGNLMDSAGKNVQTDMNLGNIRRLYTITKKIPSASITSASLDSANYAGQKNVDLLQGYTTPYGQSALVPAAGPMNYADIQKYVEQLNSQ